MTADEIARIRAADGWRIHRVESFGCAEGAVVAKGQRPPRNNIGERFLRLVATVAGLPLLLAAPVPGAAAAQEVEVRRLGELRAAGVRVPRVVHVDTEFFVMERLDGPNVSEAMAREPERSLPLWRQGLEFILDVHARGQYLSQAYARNLIVDPQGLAAVDFEDDPQQIMPLPHAQARDWLLYLHSTVWLLLPQRGKDAHLVWDQLVQADSREVVGLLDATARRMGWLRHLPEKRRPWGRDVVATQAAAQFFHDWAQRRRSS